jgi:hypothetical protein
VEYFRARLGELRRLTAQTRGVGDWRPPALLRRAGEALEGHMAGREAPPREFVPETAHLRGVIWQTSRREFELRAYVTDLAWVESLCSHARKAAAAHNIIAVEPDDEPEDSEVVERSVFFLDIEQAPLVDEGEGINWEEDAEGLLCCASFPLGQVKEPSQGFRRLLGARRRQIWGIRDCSVRLELAAPPALNQAALPQFPEAGAST